MRFQQVAPVAFLLLLPFATSDNAIDPKLEGMADVCVCIDTIYENLTDEKKSFGEIFGFLRYELGIYSQLNIPDGLHRLALVELNHNGYQVLMNLNESIVHSYGYGGITNSNYSNVQWKLRDIILENFKDLDQTTQRKIPLKDIFENIKKEVFTPEKGDRAAPDIMVYVHLTDEKNLKNFEHYKPRLDAGFDMVVGLTTYKSVSHAQKGDTVPAFFRLYNKGNWQYLDFIVSSGSGQWPLKKWVGVLTDMCKGKSTYTYTDCYYVHDPADAYGQQCAKYKNFTPPAGVEYADYCWNGEFWEMEPCDNANCENTCDSLYNNVESCAAECNKPGKQTKTYKGDNKEGKLCKKSVDCKGECVAPGSKPTDKKATPKKTAVSDQSETTAKRSESGTINTDTGLPTWAWAAIGGGIGAIVIAVLIIVVSCVLLKKKRKSSTKGKGKNRKYEESMRRGGHVSDRSYVASRGRNHGRRKKSPEETSEYSQPGSTKRDMSMSGASTNRYSSRYTSRRR